MKMRTRTARTLFIFTNGVKSENEYFSEFRDIIGRQHPQWNIKVVPIRGDPYRLVQSALIFTDIDWDEDLVWCVFDKDDFDLDETIKLSKSIEGKEVNLGISVPKFELWYLLHFEIPAENLPSEDYDKKIKAHFRKESLGEYSKGDNIFKILYEKTRVNLAIKNVKKLENGKNPSTNIHELVEFIIEKIEEM